MKRRRLVVISLDSMGFRDLNELRELTPNLARLIEQGTWVKKVRGIFPTLTYPSHTSIITGQYPAVHGIVSISSHVFFSSGEIPFPSLPITKATGPLASQRR